jgi:exosortase
MPTTARNSHFLAALLVSIVIWARPLASLVHLAISNENYSYALLVFGTAATLLVLESRSLPAQQKWPARWVGFSAVALALAGWWNYETDFSTGEYRLTIGVLAWVLFILAVFVLSYGGEAFSRLRFPLLLLLLGVPLPSRVVSVLVTVLQRSSADCASGLFHLFGIPVARNGLVFSFSNLEIEVARECSGIRSSTVLVVTALVLAQLFLRSAWSKTLVVICSLPIGVVKNGVRIFTLSVLGEYVSTDWLEGSLHRKGGVVFFALGLALVLAVIWLMRLVENQRKSGSFRES